MDDTVLMREQSSRQPGSRPPAPGQLAVLQAFLNSHFDLVENWGEDLLGTPSGLSAWLAERGLGRGLSAWLAERGLEHDTERGLERDAERGLGCGSASLTKDDVIRVLTVREALRDLIASESAPEDALQTDGQAKLNDAVAGAAFGLRLTPNGVLFVPTGSGVVDQALGVLLAVAASAMLDGSWRRLKSCPGHHCGWVFYDRSRNNSGRWCSMNVCGGREKSRAHYHRRRSHEA